MSFVKRKIAHYDVWSWSEWADTAHGFIGASSSFSDASLSAELPRFSKAFDIERLVLLNQVHSAEILDVHGADGAACADGIIAERTQRPSTAIGVRTADCVPLLLRDRERVCAVHAGWRGIAGGIIERAVERFSDPDLIEGLIGPCAGPKRYEVGPEVIAALGSGSPPVCARSKNDGKYLLALAETAKRRITAAGVSAERVHILEICTIEDVSFHSHRRQGSLRGSNLAFLVA